jgi:hypothetical protein
MRFSHPFAAVDYPAFHLNRAIRSPHRDRTPFMPPVFEAGVIMSPGGGRDGGT